LRCACMLLLGIDFSFLSFSSGKDSRIVSVYELMGLHPPFPFPATIFPALFLVDCIGS
jgi:hypothetical protein